MAHIRESSPWMIAAPGSFARSRTAAVTEATTARSRSCWSGAGEEPVQYRAAGILHEDLRGGRRFS